MAEYTYIIPDARDSEQMLLYKIAVAAGVSSGILDPSQVSGAVSYNLTTTSVGASDSGSIPAGVSSWSFVLLTGTGTFNGVAAPLTTPLSGTNPVSAIAYTTGGASSAFVMYQTAA